MPRTETRFGGTASLGTAYTLVATIGAGTAANLLVNIANRTAGAATVQAFVAASGWSSGEPTGATLVAAIAYNRSLSPGEVFQVSGIVLNAGEKLVCRSDTASAIDVIAAGVAIS